MNLQYHHILIMLTLVVSIISFKIAKNKSWFLVQLLLVFNLICELLASYLWYVLHISNAVIYNVVAIYNFIIWLLLLNNKYKFFSILIFCLFAILNFCFIQQYNHFNSYTFLLGTIIITLLIISFFYKNFIANENDLKIESYEIILLMSILLYHIGFATILFVNTWGATKTYLLPKFTVFQLISYTINTFFYGMLIWSMFIFNKSQKSIKLTK